MDEKTIITYQSESTTNQIELRIEDETVWLNRNQIAILFDRDIKTIGKHINNALKEEFYRNNFTSSQDFNKMSRFNSRLKVPTLSATPATCEVGEVCCVSGKLRVCSASNTWTIVGLQS
jgi:hypothetical protein